MKLQKGDKIIVHGYVMLSELEDGKSYKIIKVSRQAYKDVYHFAKARGTKEVVAHYAHNVDMLINPKNNNHIEIIKKQKEASKND